MKRLRRLVRTLASATSDPSGRHTTLAATIVVLVLGAVMIAHRWGSAPAGLIAGPVAAVVLLIVARRAGLSWDDLGLGRSAWRRGTAYGLAAVAVVAVAYLIAVAVPLTRSAFLDARYQQPTGRALLTAMVIVPLGTVLLEEVAFRGVILALVRRHRGVARATAFSSALFGLWHILPSLGLEKVNPALGSVVGNGLSGPILAVVFAVVFTTVSGVIFCELRRHSGSLLAAVGLHWATNGLGVVIAAGLWAAG